MCWTIAGLKSVEMNHVCYHFHLGFVVPHQIAANSPGKLFSVIKAMEIELGSIYVERRSMAGCNVKSLYSDMHFLAQIVSFFCNFLLM